MAVKRMDHIGIVVEDMETIAGSRPSGKTGVDASHGKVLLVTAK